MKNMLLILLALIITPAWAADPAEAPAASQTTSTSPEQTDESAESATPESATASCPQACRMMACPPPSGTYKLCCPVVPYTQTCP